ncbi:MAG TPA: gamma-glutamyltransferase family protein [Bacillota bacterium]|nr:gamma-glutamyltransferase family protein [Bacillota bacterium]HPM63521.1 gamma-glutamyltransferase family protein [Bacillota bacterium]
MYYRRVLAKLPRVIMTLVVIFGLLWVSSIYKADATWPYTAYTAGTRGMVASRRNLASIAGLFVLKNGGNAIDATIAVASTLSLTEPYMSGPGGNGEMTIFWSPTAEVFCLQMTGTAPYALDMKTSKAADRDRGYLAGKVPGNFGGWIVALQRFGTKSLAEVLESAIYYAKNGVPMNEEDVDWIAQNKTMIELYPTTKKIFLPGGNVPKVGELLKNPDLARTYEKLVEAEAVALKNGKSRVEALQAAYDRFYTGDIAKEFVRFYNEVGGLFTAKDFDDYEPIWRDPVHTTYKGFDVYCSGPTSRTGIELIMQLNLIEPFDVGQYGFNSAKALHLISECIKVAKSDIYQYIGDPNFIKMPLEAMCSKEYADERRKLINIDKAIPYPGPGDPWKYQKSDDAWLPVLPKVDAAASIKEGVEIGTSIEGCTTSFSVVDPFGNVVGCTPTIGSIFGTGVVVGNTGILFNNGTRNGSFSPYPENVNYGAPHKAALLGNGPAIVLKDGKPFFVFGSSGGETIGQTQFQALLNVIDFGLPVQDAVSKTAISLVANPDFYIPGATVTMQIDKRVSPDVIAQLQAMGHKTQLANAPGNNVGILIDLNSGALSGGTIADRNGQAVGF